MKLYDKLMDYSQSDFYPFHMPGHKRQVQHPFLKDVPNPYAIDITEIDGFDNLHHPEEILRTSMERAAKFYGADKSYYLVNGSSAGILSALCAVTNNSDTILMSRNCHKAAYHGVFLKNLCVKYTYPQLIVDYGIQGGLIPEEIEDMLKTFVDISAVLVVSPTYDGIVSNIRKIAEICHNYKVPLIVDEAHGAHFRYHERFPVSALDLGADIVIQSLHKTLPSFTQTAILHVKGGLVDRARLEHYLQIFQSSSPSYLFMAGIERCIDFMNPIAVDKVKGAAQPETDRRGNPFGENGVQAMQRFCDRLVCLRKDLASMKNLRLLGEEQKGHHGVWDLDISKIIVSTKNVGISGEELGEWLRRDYHLEMEMCAAKYVTAITSVMDTEEGLRRLRDALLEIDQRLDERKTMDGKNIRYQEPVPDIRDTQNGEAAVMTIADAWNQASDRVLFQDSEGRISGEYIYLYPPGIPFVVPGEKISRTLIEQVAWYREMGFSVQGMEDKSCQTIRVLSAEETLERSKDWRGYGTK